MKSAEQVLETMSNDPKRAILHMTLLVVVTFLAVKINTFLDKVWIANISKDAVTAVSTVGPIYSDVSALGIGLGTGACVCIGCYLGRKGYPNTNED